MENNTVIDVISALSTVSLPVPDLVLITIGAVLIVLIARSASNRQEKAVSKVSDAYVAELTRANRQVNSVESKLSKLKSELEKSRRRGRDSKPRSYSA